MDEATRRSLIRENEAVETIAKNGYNIEQNPVIEGTTRNPDYLIEGKSLTLAFFIRCNAKIYWYRL